MYYRGWSPAAEAECLDRVQLSDIEPEEFFNRYIARRKPCILAGSPKWHSGKHWSPLYLLSKTPEELEVRVERRASETDRFGRGATHKMKFHDFIRQIHPCLGERRSEREAALLYMTTQEIEATEDGSHPKYLCGPPCNALMGDFALRPSIMGNLIPWQYNLWMGGAVRPDESGPQYSSSGLHHDFHGSFVLYTIEL